MSALGYPSRLFSTYTPMMMKGFKNRTGVKEEAQIDLASLITNAVTQNWVGAAADAVSMYGNQTGNEQLADTASKVGMVAGLGGIVKAGLKEGGKQALKEAAKDTIKSGAGEAALRESLKGGLKPVAMEATKEAGKKSSQEILQKGLNEITKNQTKGAGKESLKKVMNTVLGEGSAAEKFQNAMGAVSTGASMLQGPTPNYSPAAASTGYTPTATALRQVLAQNGISPNPFLSSSGFGR